MIDQFLISTSEINFINNFRQHYDPNVLTYQAARMPERIRLKVNGISNAQFSVYDEFARNIPGFQPMTDRDADLLLQKTTNPVSRIGLKLIFE